ncbi:MAG: hypothetical protein PVH61_11095 [Candidatus Aminicenantes bacterium]
MARRLLRLMFVWVLVMGLASPVSAQYVVDFDYVPLYAQEQDNWSGPASGQMVMDGYPDPAYRIYYSQGLIWYIINTFNPEPGWDTDPYSLQQTLLALNQPPSGTWSLMTDTVKEDLMFDILYWMNRQEYPTPTLVYEGLRWVVIKGFQTDIEPVYGSDPELQMITIHDPFPTGAGAINTVTGTVWYDTYWQNPINISGTWFGKYVAIVEPPEAQGAVQVEFQIRSGNRDAVISPEQALAYAQYWIQQLNLSAKDPSYISLSDSKLVAYKPILVNEDLKPQVVKSENEQVCYYLLRFAPADVFEKGLVNICVIINAFTGEFEEVTSFGEPIDYLEAREAIQAASRALNTEVVAVKTTPTATVIFTPCDLTYLRAYPFWKVVINDRVIYVEMNGKTHLKFPIVPSSYGK